MLDEAPFLIHRIDHNVRINGGAALVTRGEPAWTITHENLPQLLRALYTEWKGSSNGG